MEMKTREAIEPLVNLSKTQDDPRLIMDIIKALSGIEPDPPVHEMIRIFERHKQYFNDYVRRDLIEVFSTVNSPTARDYLIEIYPRVSIDDKYVILRGLINLKDTRLLPIFKKELESPDIRVRAYAEYGLFNLSH